MGTFHHDKGELHGITVVVETHGPRVFIGRCDTLTEQHIVLLDADVHDEGDNGRTNAEFVRQAARFGHWNRHPHIVVPAGEIAAVRRLGEVPV